LINIAAFTVVVLSLVFSGCGGSSSHKGAATRSGTIKYLGHAHSIVSDALPSGSAFTIVGQRYLFMGHHYLELRAHFAEPARVKEGSASWAQGPDEIEWGTQTGCDVRPFVIVYGLLKAPDETAYTRIAGKLVALQKVSLPVSLDTTGALFYGTPSNSVSGLVIQPHAGQSIVTGDPEEPCRSHRRVWSQPAPIYCATEASAPTPRRRTDRPMLASPRLRCHQPEPRRTRPSVQYSWHQHQERPVHRR
jgi:hypothetical protein